MTTARRPTSRPGVVDWQAVWPPASAWPQHHLGSSLLPTLGHLDDCFPGCEMHPDSVNHDSTKSGQDHYNTWGLGGLANFQYMHDYTKTASRSNIRRADATILSVDTGQRWDHNGNTYLPTGYGYTQATQFVVYPRHRGNTICNVLWVDGHASGVAAAGPNDFNSLNDPLRLGTWPQSTTQNCWDRE